MVLRRRIGGVAIVAILPQKRNDSTTMGRTITIDYKSFSRPGVTYILPDPPYSAREVTITLPPGSSWTSGLHWHETHTEYLQIECGSALVTLNGVTKTYTSSDGLIVVPRYARHEWRRASSSEEVLIVKEWTAPADGEKEVFFRNLSSIIQEWSSSEGPKREWWLTLQLYVLFREMDNWPVILSSRCIPLFKNAFEWVITHVILFLASLLGSLMGLHGQYVEYTPRGR